MKIIEGYAAAEAALTRQAGFSVTYSAGLMAKLDELFGTPEPAVVVRRIIRQVREKGDAALRELTLKIDGITLGSIEIKREAIAAAYGQVDGELIDALKLAAARVYAFHKEQKGAVWNEVSGSLSQLIRPLRRVGVYVPGGTAVYPSTVLMTAVPARVAGVEEIVMVTPRQKDGGVPPAVLVAADIARVDRVFSVGGAQAVAALAYGTETVPAVDKICGPGNIFVMLAKQAVFGTVGIDALQGPSDVLIVADENSSPEYCAAELLAQAEHDALAEANLITTSRRQAEMVYRELEAQLKELPRGDIAGAALEKGVIAVVASLDEAAQLANRYAPEHLCLMLGNTDDILPKITNAGCIFTGRGATVALGDYVAGPSHALPTGGTARFSSPLNVCDFMKFTSVVNVDRLDIKKLGGAAALIARAEGLDAHARALDMRLRDISQ